MTINVKFGEVDLNVDMLGGMIAAWDEIIASLDRVNAQLHVDFVGETADAHGTVVSRQDHELMAFKGLVMQLKGAIGTAGGTGGLFQGADQYGRGLFG
ncbi:hypothetical protein [Nocardia brasiliensis]